MAGLIIGILLMVLAGIAFIVCPALPSMTSNRVNFEEALLGLIPARKLALPLGYAGIYVKCPENEFVRREAENISAFRY